MRPTPSFAVIYFGVGFTAAAALTMLVLIFVRPLVGDAPRAVLMALMVAPLVTGVLYGLRVARVGLREGLRLGAALRRGIGMR